MCQSKWGLGCIIFTVGRMNRILRREGRFLLKKFNGKRINDVNRKRRRRNCIFFKCVFQFNFLLQKKSINIINSIIISHFYERLLIIIVVIARHLFPSRGSRSHCNSMKNYTQVKLTQKSLPINCLSDAR